MRKVWEWEWVKKGKIMPIRNLSCPVDEENIPEILNWFKWPVYPFNYRPGIESLGDHG